MKKMQRRIFMTKTVVANHQSKTNNIVYLHDKLQKDLFRVLYELYCFSKTNYGEMIVEKTDAILAKAEVSDQLKERIFPQLDRKSTRLNSSHVAISYAVFCLKKKTIKHMHITS